MIRYATNNGNFSNAAIWDGGASIPASGDYVYANGFVVVLDADVNIGAGTLSTEICPTTGIGGGRFAFGTNRNIIGNVKAGTTHCVYSTADSFTTTNIVIVGNVDGATADACGIFQSISSVKNSAVIITGNISKYSVFYYKHNNTSRVHFDLTGNADTTGGYCIVASLVSTYNITVANFNINGVITGNAYEFVNPNSSATGGFGQIGTYTIVGGIVAETALKVIYCATAIVTGFIENFGGALAVNTSTSFQFTATYYKIQDADGNDVILYPSTTLENPPAESDVRAGVVYGIADAYEGTLSVGATPAEFVAALVASDLGLRMAKCAVTEEVLTMLENFE